MQQPLVSIVIPFKNTAAFIKACLQSICKQTYENWEVIAVNDHSTDNSKELVSEFCQRDIRFFQFNNTGHGIIPALQKAYAHSKGQFITRMDADDIMHPNKLQIMVDALLQHGEKHLAIGQVSYFSEQGINDGYKRYERWLNQLTIKGNNYTDIYKECVIPSPCWMVYREDFDACGAFNSTRYPEDYDLCFRFYKNKLKCIPCNHILHYWRDYQTRTSRTSPHYAQNYFLDIKLHYFLQLDRDTEKPLVIWGAGNKGKNIAKSLLEKGLHFHWLCDNPKKIGKDIYGQRMQAYTLLTSLPNPQLIITVANEDAQAFIKSYLSKLPNISNKAVHFFC